MYLLIDCPGTQSEKAGKAEPCDGCPNQKICSSGKASIPDPGKFSKFANIIVYHGLIVLFSW